ncbi:hydantoinase/oxoprolinase N-terminal domain-containing protein [Paenarthrobacter sp. YJN-5]|uniref:hydantoinase/oxoprolinase N-terminal domain-containing protein n=1 Tax=unclassified Paenarthrobacter TaxID=2634190 RepID=UPI0018776BA0|nr:hydantoinase/oxoprolinase family protein [Paenarthrobacter sp. YJN-5]QOT19925.1 hydantoinase/oxoprolinase family protein [Paenarthrobacter sp. YJN-5]
MSYKIGIDVGGTNTDAVVVDDAGKVLASTKSATTPDPFDGIRESLSKVIATVDKRQITQAMLGTTHPANAIIERRGLERVGVLRLAAPASLGIRPGAAWPSDLIDKIIGPSEIVHGGNEFDGSEIAPLDEDAIRRFAASCAGNVAAISVAGAFAPANFEHEKRAAQILAEELGSDFPVSLSHEVGALGLLERENATILNSSLLGVARHVVQGFHAALQDNGLEVDSYLTQNDGTLMSDEDAVRFPVLTLGSGPTNSMRGACSLSDLANAIVVDVGGTSADVGILVDGFPRESTAAIEVGGVRTNFRMPDLISIGLGGGSVVRSHAGGVSVGPDSVGYRVVKESLVSGGSTLTLSDISVRGGRLKGFGDPSLAQNVDGSTVDAALAWVDEQIRIMADRMKASRHTLPLIAVGGGSHLVPDSVPGVSEVVRPENYAVANAYGAAIAEASGTIDRVFSYEGRGREACLDEARNLAVDSAIRSGADPNRIRITSLSEVPLSYVPGNACRVQVKAAGPLVSP